MLKINKNVVVVSMFIGILFMLLGFSSALIFYVGVFVFITPYFFIYAKSIDEAVMVRKINTKKLREGDWLYKDIKVGRKMIKASWRGLNQKNIKDIQKKHKYVRIRHGIVFIPVFLISFIIYGILLGTHFFNSFVSFFTGI